jgi:hypothetical protein
MELKTQERPDPVKMIDVEKQSNITEAVPVIPNITEAVPVESEKAIASNELDPGNKENNSTIRNISNAHINRDIIITNKFVKKIVTENVRKSHGDEAAKESKKFIKSIDYPGKWFIKTF